MIEIPFSEINDNDEFWSGAIFRRYGTNLNIISQEEDFFEYMLVDDPGFEYMLCVHIDKWEAGTSVCHLSKTVGLNRHTVLANEFRKKMILPDEVISWFYVTGGIRETITRA